MAALLHQLMILPILLPLAVGAVLLFFNEHRYRLKSAISLTAAGILVVIAVVLVIEAQQIAPRADVYHLGSWPAPFGIVLVLDKLSAVMLLLSAVLGVCALMFSLAYWQKVGAYFHSLMQFLLVGINGAFLTGDIFNLFVFFEVMLTASYALVLHGSGVRRVRSGMHYVVVNLVASSCFLIGAALIYGVAGTLNMADLAVKAGAIAEDEQRLFMVAAAILGIAFFVKVAMWPFGFWLPPSFGAAAAPVAAIAAILSEVGIYVILRLSLLIFGDMGGVFANFGSGFLFYSGLVTMAFGLIGVLASQSASGMTSYSVIVSSGTLLAAIGTTHAAITDAVVYYMLSSTLALAALFLLVELLGRIQDSAGNVLAVTMEVYGDDEEDEEEDIGVYIPSTLVVLGVCFMVCAMLLVGMPPLSGFLGKFMLISGIMDPEGFGRYEDMPSSRDWLYISMLIVSSFVPLIAMIRAGMRIFWAPIDSNVPRVQIIEIAPVIVLMVLCLVLTVLVSPVMHYLYGMALSLHEPVHYINSVLGG
ncbi:MAG: Monovalent cation/H+ antiporter subunit D [Candidatus Tokpelaia hoelldobleri]|uniref:Monovalent cation/H+ antiporter subunit D n=1 Tax=Candidatus Tokpelaia hoelldobleri TaxID=1902579 RepID=A0A1U9JSD8_9HYPH|nr:MAG: Monovalent cation/H+ antiporter subunit D [Candidatus Tokpelaia hoelldoblerii]